MHGYGKKEVNLTLVTYAIYITIFKAQGLPTYLQYLLQITMLGIVAIYFGFVRRSLNIKNISVIFSGTIIISTLVSYFKGTSTISGVFNSIFYGIGLFFFYEIIGIWVQRKKIYKLIKVLLIITSIYCLITFVSVLILGNQNSEIVMYFFGGKFVSCYYFLFMLALAYTYYQNRIKRYWRYKIGFVCLNVIVILFSVYINCTTAILLGVLFGILAFVPNVVKVIMRERKVLCLCILGSACILFVLQIILDLPLIQRFIVDVLGKSINLTSRTPIYTRYLLPLISASPVFGYGHSSAILHTFTPYWNAQNGLGEIVLNYGFSGAVAFMTTVWVSVGKNTKNSYFDAWGIYALLYVFCLAAVVEISYDYIFIICVYILCQLKNWSYTQ